MSWTEITREQYRRDGLHYASDIDSQNGAACGFDAAKRLKRGQRHIVTVQVHAVNIQDNHRAVPLLKSLGPAFPKLNPLPISVAGTWTGASSATGTRRWCSTSWSPPGSQVSLAFRILCSVTSSPSPGNGSISNDRLVSPRYRRLPICRRIVGFQCCILRTHCSGAEPRWVQASSAGSHSAHNCRW